jgi:hypothetical protein
MSKIPPVRQIKAMTEYQKIADKHLEKLRELREEKERIEKEMKYTRDLVKAAINMIPDEEKGPYIAELGHQVMVQMGLTMTIREMLQQSDVALTPTTIKENLDAIGYDFSEYKSNPLSSIHSILKRFKPSQVERLHLMDGTIGYRWKRKQVKKQKKVAGEISGLAGLDKPGAGYKK